MRMSKDARLKRFCFSLMILVATAAFSQAATIRTTNFIVTAPTAEIAQKCGKTAEFYRKALAEEWLGKEMKPWFKPCTLSVKVGQIGAGGATTFAFDRGEVFGWRMNVQGSLERILDSVIPHEVSHTIFACHFRRPLPRWADEGAATLIEHESERRRQSMLLKQVWSTPRRIPLTKLLSIKEYPRDMQSVLTLYAEGYSLADFLVQAGGKKRYLDFLETAHRDGWDRAIAEHYRLKNVNDLESRWNNWVMAGSPELNIPKDSQLAANESQPARETKTASAEFERPVIRGQSPEVTPAPPEERVAAAPQPEPKPTIPLPQTREVREESPGWRRMREQLKDIPEDFVNPAHDPARQIESSPTETTQAEVAASKDNPAFPPANAAASSPASNEPAFRFELNESSYSPGGQPSR